MPGKLTDWRLYPTVFVSHLLLRDISKLHGMAVVRNKQCKRTFVSFSPFPASRMVPQKSKAKSAMESKTIDGKASM